MIEGRSVHKIHVLFLVFALGISACTYGPPELGKRVTNHVARGEDAQFAFAVRLAWMRRPTGLSAFPDGGRWKVLAEAAAVYTCDTLSLRTTRIWNAPRPETIRAGFEPWMGPWDADGIYVSLRGYRRPGPDHATLERFDYLIDASRRVRPAGPEQPRGPATSRPQRCEELVIELAESDHLAIVGPAGGRPPPMPPLVDSLYARPIAVDAEFRLRRGFDYSEYYGVLRSARDLERLWNQLVHVREPMLPVIGTPRPDPPAVDFTTTAVLWFADQGARASFVESLELERPASDTIRVAVTVFHSDFGSRRLNLWAIPRTASPLAFEVKHIYEVRSP